MSEDEKKHDFGCCQSHEQCVNELEQENSRLRAALECAKDALSDVYAVDEMISDGCDLVKSPAEVAKEALTKISELLKGDGE